MHINIQELLSFFIFLAIACVIFRKKLIPILDTYIKNIVSRINSLHAKEKVSQVALESAISEHSESFMYSEKLLSIANNKVEEIKGSLANENEKIRGEFDRMLGQYEKNLKKQDEIEYVNRLFDAVNVKMLELDAKPKIKTNGLKDFVEKVKAEHECANKRF